MEVFIIILHFGDINTTKNCIHSILEFEKSYKKIVIVNNDGNSLNKSIFDSNKNIFVINSKKNIGFAAGVNVGIQYALSNGATHVLLLNNDTVLDSPVIEKLVKIFTAKKGAGIVGPVIWYKKNNKKVYDFGGYYNKLIGRTHHSERDAIKEASPKAVEYISGCCVLIKREVFETIGLFDERYFLYYEDVDFAIRARKYHFLSYVVPGVTLFHELSKAKGRLSTFSVYYQTKSGVIFGKEHAKMRVLNVCFLLLQSVVILSKDIRAGISAFSGLFDGLKIEG